MTAVRLSCPECGHETHAPLFPTPFCPHGCGPLVQLLVTHEQEAAENAREAIRRLMSETVAVEP